MDMKITKEYIVQRIGLLNFEGGPLGAVVRLLVLSIS